MKKLFATFLLVAAMFVTFQSTASASVINFTANMLGVNEVPSNTSTATGFAIVTVDDVLNIVTINMSYVGITGGPPSAAHIHCCAFPGTNAPVVIPFTGFPTTLSGSYVNTFTGVSAVNIAGIKAGQGYVNIHNAVFPGGEIRGQLVAPEPSIIGLLGVGLIAIAFYSRRRKVCPAK